MLGSPGSLRRLAHKVDTSYSGNKIYREDDVEYRVVTEGNKFLLQTKLLYEDEWCTILTSMEPFS